jgi:predicted MFS family arabinose efflux permease
MGHARHALADEVAGVAVDAQRADRRRVRGGRDELDVQPTITPLIMGAGYIAGAYFFVRVARETRWHRIQVGFLPVTAFTLFMAIGTFNHLDRFATAHVAFWIWVGLYVATPVLVPRHRRRRQALRATA